MRGNAPAVIQGVLKHFSVSQVKTFRRCPRLWYSDKVLGIKQERKPGSGAEVGGKLHKQPEDYYKHGKEPTHEAFQRALIALPPRHPELRVERSLDEPELYVEDVRLEGYADLIVPGHLRDDGIPYVLDWKFVSSFRYNEDPANDLQCLLYGYWVSRKWPGTREIRVGLHYFLQDGSDYKPSVKVVPVERCESEWEDIVVPTVQRMRTMAAWGHEKGWGLEQVPDNRGDACYAYGGCFLMEPCGVVPKGKADREVRSTLKDFDMGLG